MHQTAPLLRLAEQTFGGLIVDHTPVQLVSSLTPVVHIELQILDERGSRIVESSESSKCILLRRVR